MITKLRVKSCHNWCFDIIIYMINTFSWEASVLILIFGDFNSRIHLNPFGQRDEAVTPNFCVLGTEGTNIGRKGHSRHDLIAVVRQT